jgi:hypothetical protein
MGEVANTAIGRRPDGRGLAPHAGGDRGTVGPGLVGLIQAQHNVAVDLRRVPLSLHRVTRRPGGESRGVVGFEDRRGGVK